MDIFYVLLRDQMFRSKICWWWRKAHTARWLWWGILATLIHYGNKLLCGSLSVRDLMNLLFFFFFIYLNYFCMYTSSDWAVECFWFLSFVIHILILWKSFFYWNNLWLKFANLEEKYMEELVQFNINSCTWSNIKAKYIFFCI